jgi:hypothetical protein
MALEGWYYLHTNGSLIYKRELGGTAADIRESDFACAMWPMDPANRAGAWNILVESLALGADASRVKELAAKWHCDDADAANYAQYLGLNLFMDGNAWCATLANHIDLQTSPAGFGDTALEAIAALCRELGYTGGKMWNATFKDLCAGKAAA